MNFKLSSAKADTVSSGITAVGTSSATPKSGSPLARLDRKMRGELAKILKREGFKGKSGSSTLIHSHGRLKSDAVLVLGTAHKKKGDLAPNDLEILRRAAATAARTANHRKAKSLSFDLTTWASPGTKVTDQIQAAVEGMELGTYRFESYLKPKRPTLKQVQLLTSNTNAAARKAIKIGQAVANGTNLARDLVNTPAADMTPRELGRRARKVGAGIRTKIFNKQEIRRMKMGSFLAVSHGSVEPPALIHMTYRPKGRSKGTVAIIGKGVTFDSGGLSLKPPGSMETMKDDMAGAAATIGFMQVLSTIRPAITVHGIIAATENMPSGSAVKPGDVARAMNGKTIEILNTDAEGRLTLADALHYSLKKKPDAVIDMATLTGACLVALGEQCAGLMGNDQKLLAALKKSADHAGEMIWQLPLIEAYRSDLKSPIADLKNIGGRWGGTIEAGLFLQEFVDEKVPWAHLDIAGPSWANKPQAYSPRGGTGCMVRTLTHYILSL